MKPILVRTRLRNGLLFLVAAAALALVVIGCGSGSDFVPTVSQLWKQQGATYVGRTACRDCHANIYDQYMTQPMGEVNPATSEADSRHVTKDCSACHVTGFGEPTGGVKEAYNADNPLDGIGCESCHGPGSKHIAAGSTSERKAQITREVPDKTCWNCHGDRFNTPDGYVTGAMFQPIPTINEAYLKETTASSIRGPHYPPAAFLMGVKGYDTAQMTSPHSKLPNTCIACHGPEDSPVTGKADHGPDTWEPKLDTTRAECASCHSGRSEDDQLVQLGVKKLMIELMGANPNDPSMPDTASMAGGLLAKYAADNGLTISSNAAKDDPKMIKYKAARWNTRYVYTDHSYGIHNPAFAKKLLEDAKALLTEE